MKAERDMDIDPSTARIFDRSDEKNPVLLCRLENTGNGFIARFPGNGSTRQENYVCLDYAETSYLYATLKKFKKELK